MAHSFNSDLLIAGGLNDPNLNIIRSAARARGLDIIDLCHGPSTEPEFLWSLGDDGTLIANGRQVRPGAAFLRWNVFQSNGLIGPTLRDDAWHATVSAFIQNNEQIAHPNRDMSYTTALKIPMLMKAKEVGLEIPVTKVTNTLCEYLGRPSDYIAKPVCGGAEAVCLSDAISEESDQDWIKASPAFVQTKLSYPEYRVFVVYGRVIVFQINSDKVDYRGDNKARIEYFNETKIPAQTAKSLRELSDRMKVDFCACDFKTNPKTGSWVFLEMNNAPMFAAFDKICLGEISETLLDCLCSTLPKQEAHDFLVRPIANNQQTNTNGRAVQPPGV